MDLFKFDHDLNILPYDGEVNYFGSIIAPQQSQNYTERLLETITWKHDQVVIYGKHITTARKTAWYGDENYPYTYSNTTKHALSWNSELLELKAIVEKFSQLSFNSCLLNLYHSGVEGMAWHSDDEKVLGRNAVIASLSLGAERKFSFKHKRSKETISIRLENGSLLLMKKDTQNHWLHSLPKTTKVSEPRINLTFRRFLG
jgi:alkylated DNA repair dioxygenase AlkB